jgi:peptidoglycan/LPS O-acetylase OafA/YrhL
MIAVGSNQFQKALVSTVGAISTPRDTFQSTIIPQVNLLPGVLGLRGIAALAVVLFHVVGIAKIAVPQPFAFIAADFGKGVHLFFVLSAFSLMHSTGNTIYRPTWVREYFIKRFFRIAPLYYGIMAGMILWPLLVSGAWLFNLETLLLNLTFTFGFAPWTGIVWAGWSVGVEMIFYAIFPVLLLTIRTREGTLVLVILSVVVTYAARASLDAHYEHTVSLYQYNWGYFSFAANLCFFAMGMYAFQVVTTVDKDSRVMRWFVPAAAITILGALLFTEFGRQLKLLWKSDLIFWGVGLSALCAWQAARPSRWSANKVFEYLGERSYSLYLLHPGVIVLFKTRIQDLYHLMTPQFGAYAYFFCAAFILGPILLLAEGTYRLIEVPCIRFGCGINNRTTSSSI